MLLVVLAVTIDWSTVGARLRRGDWEWAAAAVAALVAGLVVAAWRWHQLLGAVGVAVPFRSALRAHAVGTFANTFLPTGFGGDAARAYGVTRGREAVARAATAVVVDRLTALGCLVLLAWIATGLRPATVPAELLVALAAVTVAGAAAGGALLAATRSARLAARLPARARPLAALVQTALTALSGDARLAGRATAGGLVYQALLVTSVVWLGRTIGVELPFALAAVAITLVLLLTVLPISIAGFGVREGGFVAVLAPAGVGAAEATLLSLLCVAALAASSLPGAAALAAGGLRGARD